MSIDVEALYRSYGPMVLRRCGRLLCDEHIASDAMHDVFLELLRRQHDLNDHSLEGLLMTATTNHCLNRLRTRKHRHEVLPSNFSELPSHDPVEDRTLTRRFLTRLFNRHPQTTRLIAFLHYVDRLTLDEVAHAVDMSVSGVRKRLQSLQLDCERMGSLQNGRPFHKEYTS
jgi:RNA polymerase sigma-70 factor (ECF subfamily)